MRKQVQISKVTPDPNNPRTIRDDKFAALVKSLQEFPEMLEKRPIVVTQEYVALGGNMRLKAAKEAGLKTVWVFVTNWTEQQQREFRYKDNNNAGRPPFGVTVEQADNSLLVIPVFQHIHGVTDIEARPNGYRNSFIFYPLKAFIEKQQSNEGVK